MIKFRLENSFHFVKIILAFFEKAECGEVFINHFHLKMIDFNGKFHWSYRENFNRFHKQNTICCMAINAIDWMDNRVQCSLTAFSRSFIVVVMVYTSGYAVFRLMLSDCIFFLFVFFFFYFLIIKVRSLNAWSMTGATILFDKSVTLFSVCDLWVL